MLPVPPTVAAALPSGSAPARPDAAQRLASRPSGQKLPSQRSPLGAPPRGLSDEASRLEAAPEGLLVEGGSPRGWRAVLRAFMDGGDRGERSSMDVDVPKDVVMFAAPQHNSMYHSHLAERLASDGVGSGF